MYTVDLAHMMELPTYYMYTVTPSPLASEARINIGIMIYEILTYDWIR